MSKTNKMIAGVIAVVVIIVAVVLAAKQPNPQPAPAESQEPIKIGGIFALTGLGASQGQQELKGAQLAVEEINAKGGVLGRPLELKAEDVSLDKLRVASTATRKLIDVDQVVAIVGPQWDEPAAAVLPITEEEQVSTISPDVTRDLESEVNFDYFFSTWHDNRVGIRTLVEFAAQQNWDNVAIIRLVGGGFMQYTRDLFIEMAPEYEVNIIADIDVGNPLETDFRTHLTKIKPLNPDAIFMAVVDPTECALMKQLKELDMNVPVLATESAGNEPSLQACANELENLYFSTPRHTAKYADFASRFAVHFGQEPKFTTVVNAYDAVGVIARALEQTDLNGGKALRDVIANITDYKGVALENIAFDNKGFVITPDDAFEIRTVRNGQFVPYEE